MKTSKSLVITIICSSFFIQNSSAYAQTTTSNQELAHDISALFRAYRKVIAVNKDAIHKPGEFFKNPEERIRVFHKHAKTYYKLMTKKEYPEDNATALGKVRKDLGKAVETVITNMSRGDYDFAWKGDNDFVKKWDGKFLPARFAILMADEFNKASNNKVTIKLTTSEKLLVNKDNAPDAWESDIIEKFFLNTKVTKSESKFESLDDRFRYMLPEYYGPNCIQCHGTKSGQDGLKIHPSDIPRSVGSFAGGISVTIMNE